MASKPPVRTPNLQRKTSVGLLSDDRIGHQVPVTPAPPGAFGSQMSTQTKTLEEEEQELRQRQEIERQEQEIRIAEIEQTCQAEALRKIEAMQLKEKQRQEQPYASGSGETPVSMLRPAAKKKKSVKIERSEGPDFSYDKTTTEDEESSDMGSIDSETMRSKSRGEQAAILGKVRTKFSAIMLKEMERQDDVPQDVV